MAGNESLGNSASKYCIYEPSCSSSLRSLLLRSKALSHVGHSRITVILALIMNNPLTEKLRKTLYHVFVSGPFILPYLLLLPYTSIDFYLPSTSHFHPVKCAPAMTSMVGFPLRHRSRIIHENVVSLVGDVIGCGISFLQSTIFVMLNGFLGEHSSSTCYLSETMH